MHNKNYNGIFVYYVTMMILIIYTSSTVQSFIAFIDKSASNSFMVSQRTL